MVLIKMYFCFMKTVFFIFIETLFSRKCISVIDLNNFRCVIILYTENVYYYSDRSDAMVIFLTILRLRSKAFSRRIQ